MKKRSQPTAFGAADRAFFAGLFASVAEEMGVVLRRTAYSPNIKERCDFSCAVFDEDGAMVAQAAHIPVHLGALPMSVQAVRAHLGDLAPGDVAMLNDPYAGGTHLPDITLVSPCWAARARRPVAYLASRAHHADVGGATPGSMPLARDIYAEGIRIPPVLLVRDGAVQEDLLRFLLANVRTPDERRGDLQAQWAAHQVGGRRLAEALEEHGVPRMQAAMKDLLHYGEWLVRDLLRRLPQGRFRFSDALDDDGLGNGPLPIAVELTVANDKVTVDFTGTAPACPGSLNAVEAITRSAVAYCFLCLLAEAPRSRAASAWDPPMNSGCFRPFDIRLPPGSLVNAPPGHVVAGGNVETSQRIVDVVFGALAQALPDLLPAASQGTMNNLTLGGFDPSTGRPFAYYETMAGGTGAHARQSGASAMHSHMTNTLNTPVEALEFAYPLRVERYEVAVGTGGRGRHRGGDGLRRDLRALAPMRGVLLTERRASAPYGLQGGEPGAPGRNRRVAKGVTRNLPAKCEFELSPGDVVCVQTPGGGGFGRAPQNTPRRKVSRRKENKP